jgi:UDP-N-acetylglucosamine diphosphorylase / glucose-1-phosphate thymidylyltransferase / UDP-N-acetylgalactosamine diphosphorylase / glucosamine-1-phosphate N-acetyltransferase / galactosamine-1-phosphate N-acetyltransferase
MATPVVIIEHPQPLLSPLADLRPQCCIRTGALTLLERLQEQAASQRDIEILGMICPPSRDALYAQQTGLPVNPSDLPRECLCLMSHCVLLPQEALSLGTSASLVYDDQIFAARTNPSRFIAALAEPSSSPLTAQALGLTPLAAAWPRVLSRPWSVRTHRDAALAHDLALLTAAAPAQPAALPRVHNVSGATILALPAGPGLHMHPLAKVYPGTIFDCEHGAIALDAHAVVRPGAILIGPCYVGPNSTVLERATIRPGTAIGPWCKVNGEVGGTIFQGYANKAHDGYVGDSFVGEWCNLGAGTTTSNLLNTYSETIAKANPDARNERTGEVFLGCIFGDHTKTAICTRIMTASVLHTGSMFATTAAVSGTVPRFRWATDAGVSDFRIDKFIDVMKTQMARRKIVPSEAYVAALQHLAQ